MHQKNPRCGRCHNAWPAPCLEFVFSWEAQDGPEDYRGVYYSELCPRCGTSLIEIYPDRLLRPSLLQAISLLPVCKDPDDDFVWHSLSHIDTILLHELAHWAGCSEEQALSLDDMRLVWVTYECGACHGTCHS